MDEQNRLNTAVKHNDLRVAEELGAFPIIDSSQNETVQGLLGKDVIQNKLSFLKALGVDDYISHVVEPAENPSRPNILKVIASLPANILIQQHSGPFSALEVELFHNGAQRRIGIIAQNRNVQNGAWSPGHHELACKSVKKFASYGLPIVYFIDTPGADAGEDANSGNQAHSISKLIAITSNAEVPTVGVILGLGYSGGAIPLANCNVLLSVKDGVFNTIQPKGLASIARKFKLSWQQCAQFVGVSPYELQEAGCIDGIIDYSPFDKGDSYKNLLSAICDSIKLIELRGNQFIRSNKYLGKLHEQHVNRQLKSPLVQPSAQSTDELMESNSQHGFMSLPNIAYRELRYLSNRHRIKTANIKEYEQHINNSLPEGDMLERIEKNNEITFKEWLSSTDKVIYNDDLLKAWNNYQKKHKELGLARTGFAKLVLGEPLDNYKKAKKTLLFKLSLSLYNRWKSSTANNFQHLLEFLRDHPTCTFPENSQLTVLNIISHADLKDEFIDEFQGVIAFDVVYDLLLENLVHIAKETQKTRALSYQSIDELLSRSFDQAINRLDNVTLNNSDITRESLREHLSIWLDEFKNLPTHDKVLRTIEGWKNVAHPQLSETLFVVLTYFYEHLLPIFFKAKNEISAYTGEINPVRIGKRKDFWNRLNIACQDLQIQSLLNDVKRHNQRSAKTIIDCFISDFTELGSDIVSANPVKFPGYHQSIQTAVNNHKVPCGVITGTGQFKGVSGPISAGFMISNPEFQAGAFDMASARKFCDLLAICAEKEIPVICFVSSGGMQTKEGAAALFSMTITNDRITHFVRDHGLSISVVGFGDCTGGAQASFVTHPLVNTFYFSGTNMPFAGQMVVPAYLPTKATLSNYLSQTEGAMNGLVQDPFEPTLDSQLREIDPAIPVPDLTLKEALSQVLSGKRISSVQSIRQSSSHLDLMAPVRKTLIHARGCTAVKLIRKAQESNISIVLVASDADMQSQAAEMLGPNDRLICIGGNTPEESYLNADSIITIANYEQVDSLHPGIGFLSENAEFSNMCVENEINFIGPLSKTIKQMGNKANAINTSINIGVPVVPGSHGVLRSTDEALKVAESIGYPVLIKAVHGGGGKGIRVVARETDLLEAYKEVSIEAGTSFGSSDLYLEKYITSLRHIEVQIIRDRYKTTKVLGLRDCTVQRNKQKILEESDSTMLTDQLKSEALDYAKKLAEEVDYIGVGTVEFIYDLDNHSIYFMEMNTRLQVEHPVTEMVSGVDIVNAQFAIASGESITNLTPVEKGHAIEVRITAEKANITSENTLELLPSPGTITKCEFPEHSDNIDVITAAAEDKQVTPFYDSLIAQITCHGDSRKDAINTLVKFLTATVIEGINTNISLVLEVLTDPVFINGDYDTNYLDNALDRFNRDNLLKGTKEIEGPDDEYSLEKLTIEGTSEIKVLAPMTGIFYSAPSPSDPPYIKNGDIISTDRTIGLMEAMKMFSPISLGIFNQNGKIYSQEKNYQVEQVNVPNGNQVTKGDLLFVISEQ